MITESVRNLFQALGNILRTPELKTKILWTLFFLIIYRIGSHIPVPGIQLDVLDDLVKQQGMGGDSVLGAMLLLSMLTGGALANCAIFSLGIMPYISSSIIFSLLVKVIPSLEALSKEGPSGYRKINEYTRYCTVPLCILQSYMIAQVFKRQMLPNGRYLVSQDAGIFFDFMAVVALTSGAIFLMWLGEQISEYGLGNGISLLIMAGIIVQMPKQVHLILTSGSAGQGGSEIGKFFFLVALFCLIVAAVVYITYGQRKIAVQQAKHTRGRKVYGGQRHFLPLKVNQSGVMPVIFASSVMVVPMTLYSWIAGGDSFGLRGDSFWYITLYILMVYFFSYFWTSLMFQPVEMAEQLKEYGSFIPGIRPGAKTAEHLEKTMLRVTFVGAAFLAFIALFPQLAIMSLELTGITALFAYNLGGTSILIVVGVVLEMIQKLESHLLMRHYDGFIK